MMPILVKGDDVRSGRKANARHRSQWVKGYIIWTCTVWPIMSSYLQHLFHLPKSSHRFQLIFFSDTEDIVLIEFIK